MAEKQEWVAFLGHLEHLQFSTGPFRLFCSPACAGKAGHRRSQPITESAAAKAQLVDATDRCAQCGKPFEPMDSAAKEESAH